MGIYTAPQSAFKPAGAGRQILGLFGGIAGNLLREQKQKALQEAINQYGLVPEVVIDDEGKQKITWKQPKAKQETKPADIFKNLLGVSSGLLPPEQVMKPEELAQVTPSTLGPAEGGQVLAMPGQQAEFLPGYEPKPFPQAIPGMLRQRLGITEEEAKRKALGLGKGERKSITPAQALNIISDPYKSQQFKRQYPELYPELERLAREALKTTSKPVIEEDW